MKKLVSFLLSAAMILSLAACGNGDGASSQSNEPTDSSGKSSSAAASTSEESSKDQDESKSEPSNEDEVTLTAFIQQSVTSESGIWKGWGAQRLLEDLNIKIDFYPTGNEVEQKLAQYLAAGDLPDIVGLKGLDQAQYAMDAKMLLDLNEYKDYIPAVFDGSLYEQAIQYSMDKTSNNTGGLFILPTAVGPVSYNAFNWVPLLQWDTYKKVGSPRPATLEDYLDIVEKMVAEKPETPDGEKVYGFSLFSDWDKYTAVQAATLSFFYGIDTEYVSHLMETDIITNETKSLLADDSFYKRSLQFYFDANQRGLLDPDSMTQTFSNVEAKYNSGRVMFSHYSWMTGNYNSPASGHVNNEEAPDGYANVPADDMKIYEAPDQTIGRNWYFAVSQGTKSPERAAQLINWLFDPDVNAFLSNGPEGVAWEFDENGEPYVTEEGWDIVDNKAEPLMPEETGGGLFQDGVYTFNTLGAASSYIMEDGYTLSYRYWPTTPLHNLNLMKLENNKLLTEWMDNGDEAVVLDDYLRPQGMISQASQAVNMVPPVSDEMEMTVAQIGEIVKKYSWQMIYASSQEEFDRLWTEMQTQADGLGMPGIVEYYTDAWQDALDLVGDYE